MELRHYQRSAIDAIYAHYALKRTNALLSIATGCGKSYIMATLLKETLKRYPPTRFIVATFSKELVKQNHDELLKLWPGAPAGILSAGLRQRATQQQIIFAGIQTAYKMAFELQRCDCLLIDECQAIPHGQDGMWRRFIGDLLRINPHMKIIGLSATIFRMDSGLLHRGKGALFQDVIFEYGLLEAIKDGYLCEVVPAPVETRLTTKGVQKRGGEFVAGELERAVDVESTTQAAVREIVRLGAGRRSWLIFAAGVKHAEHVRDAVRLHGIDCEMVTANTLSRDKMLERFKGFSLRALVVVGIGNVGFNHPGLDLIASLRPTGSAVLWLQQAGRGTRLYAGKTNCLLLDMASNIDRHGPLDKIKGHDPKEKTPGEAMQKRCEKCWCYCHSSARNCPDCGEPFTFSTIDDKLSATASNAAILSTQIAPTTLQVKDWTWGYHEKPGKPVSMMVSYKTGITTQREWLCWQHDGPIKNKAIAWWARHGGQLPPPALVSEAIARMGEAKCPKSITIRPNGKYQEIVGREW